MYSNYCLIDTQPCDNLDFDLHEAISKLSVDQPMIEINLGLNQELEALLYNLHITQSAQYSIAYNGINMGELQESLSNFLEKLVGNNQHEISSSIANSISYWSDRMFLAQNEKNLWIYLSATINSDKPYRWHTDTPFRFDASGAGIKGEYSEYKKCALTKEFFILLTLKGPSTEFYKLNHDMREEFVEYSILDDSLDKNKKIGSLINESNRPGSTELAKSEKYKLQDRYCLSFSY